jgi:hypothetical protein
MQARMWVLGLTLLVCRSVVGEPVFEAKECVSDPCGDKSYCIMKEKADPARQEDADEKIIAADRKTNTEVVLVRKSNKAIKEYLINMQHLRLSPDNKTLYFDTFGGGGPSNNVYAIDLTTGKHRFFTYGDVMCVIHGKRFWNDILIMQHTYFIQGGSYDALFLYDSKGHELGMASYDWSIPDEICEDVNED